MTPGVVPIRARISTDLPMVYVYATALTALNLLFLASVLFGLPGTWLMLLAAIVADALLSGHTLFAAATLWTCVFIALSGEVLEFVLGAAGARRAGGSRRGTLFAIAGSIAGAIIGTGIPLPVLGTLLGACLGAFAGSVFGDLLAGRDVGSSVAAGRGAASGRFWGTVAKMIAGTAIVLVLAVAAYA